MAATSLGCSGVGFNKSSETSVSKTDVKDPPRDGDGRLFVTPTPCTEQVKNITYPVKIIFVVDASGSNSAAFSNSEKTDPLRNFRYYSILSFLTTFASKTNFSYQMISFQGDSALTYIANSNDVPVFSHVNDMKSALEYFMTKVTDYGKTPYRAALNNTREVISGGGPDAPNTRYAVVFLTDGMPTDVVKYVNDPTGYSLVNYDENKKMYAVVDEQGLLNDVYATVNVKPNITSLSTVFYGRNGQFYTEASKNRLRQMASAGRGKFIDASLAENIHIEDTLSLPEVTCTY